MHYSLGILIAVVCINAANGGRILAVHGTDLNSHFRVFSGVVEKLAPFHNITFYMDSVFNYNAPPNVVVRTFDAPSRTGSLNMTELFQKPCSIDSYELFYNHILTTNKTYFETVLKSSDTSQLFNLNESYDLLLMAGYGSEHFFQLAHTLDIPFVQVTPSILMPWNNEGINNPYSMINDFSFAVPDAIDTFSGRLIKFVKNVLINYRYYWAHMSTVNSATKTFFPPGTPSIEEINKKTDLIFVNSHNVMGYTRPNIPTVVEIGGLHIKPPKALPRDLEEFVSGAGDNGFIYFSLGSLIQESAMSEYIREGILNVFSKLPQRVLWKWKGNMPDAPPNVKISKWLPQGDILAHKNIKLFITQGGMLSMQEAVYHGVPVLIVPVIFDQYINAFLAEKKGCGKSITFCQFTENLFGKYVKELLNNSSYTKSAKHMSRAMKYQNNDLSKKVNWWIDFVISQRGTKVLQPLIQYETWTDMPFDVLSFFTFIVSCVLYLLVYATMYILKTMAIYHSIGKSKND